MLELNYARRGRRHSVDMLCELIRRDCDVPLNHRITDLSAYGAWIQTSFPMPVGSRIVLAFTPPGADELMVFAEVTRVRDRSSAHKKTGMGVAFSEMTQPERLQLLMALRRVPDDTIRVMRFARLIH